MRKSIFTLIGITLLISNVSALSWSGYEWVVESGEIMPPVFSNPRITWDPNNAYVDSDDKLHLELNYKNDSWNCVMLQTVKDFTYGKYTWVVSSQSLNLDKNVVLGLFTRTDDTHEIDIESAQWGDSSSDHLQFTCHPESVVKGVRFVSFDSNYVDTTGVTYTFDWQPTYIHYTATASNDEVIADWYYTYAKGVPKVPAKVMMNIWMYKGVPPSNGEPVEVVISSFHRS